MNEESAALPERDAPSAVPASAPAPASPALKVESDELPDGRHILYFVAEPQ